MKRRTAQRTKIEQVFAEAGRPLGPREVLEAARADLPGLSIATVYRTLKRMVEEEAIVSIDLPGESARYEPKVVAERHHHHFRCMGCNAVYDLEGCVDGLCKLLPEGFELRGHELLLIGLCTDCAD